LPAAPLEAMVVVDGNVPVTVTEDALDELVA
jgi:hypothetical protein